MTVVPLRLRTLGRRATLDAGLADDPAWPLAEQVLRGRSERALGCRRVAVCEIDDLGVQAPSFVDQRATGVARPQQGRANVQSAAPSDEPRRLQHVAAM